MGGAKRPLIRNRLAPAARTGSVQGVNLHLPARKIARLLWRDWIRPLALPFFLITAAKSALADINYVPSGSMQPTILPGDVVVIDKLAYDLRVPFTFARLARWADPARGDIVVCFSPEDGTRLVKRIVALPGDTVELRDDVLWLNGIRQTYTPLGTDAPGVRDLPAAERASAIFAREHFRLPASTAASAAPPTPPASRSHAVMVLPARPALRTWGPVRVPAGHYWALGDNRDNSHDSRFYGPVPRSAIIGRARAVAVSADLDRWLLPRFGRFFTALE